MNQNITFKFEFETGNANIAHSLMNVVLRKIKQLQELCPDVNYVEAKVCALAFHEDRKEADLLIKCNDEQFRAQAKAERWNDALLDAFDKASTKIKQQVLVY